jgi:hypothetical protein
MESQCVPISRDRHLISGRGAALLAVFYWCAAAPAGAQGGPPMLTDDPGTPGNGQWEINTAVLEDRTAGARARSLPHVDVNYGLGDQIQLKFETGYLFTDGPASDGTKHDWDDSLLGVKWRFADQEKNGVDVSTYPQLELQNSRRAVSRAIAQPGPNVFLPLEVARSFGSFAVVGEVGYQYSSDRPNQWVAGALGAYEATKRLELLAEVRNASDTFLSGGDLVVNLGLRLELTSKIKLLAAAGTGLRQGPDATRFVGYLGFQYVTAQPR